MSAFLVFFSLQGNDYGKADLVDSYLMINTVFVFLPASIDTCMYERKIAIDDQCGLDLLREVLNGKWKFHLLWFIGN